MKELVPQSIRNIYHLFRSMFSAVWFGFPAKKLKVVGVTGTNGKTTTVQMIAKILEEAGHKVAVASTINFKIGDWEEVNDTKYTTRSAWHTQKFIQRAVKEKCDYLVQEVASHALDQNRLWGIKFDVAAITNVTREHLDYHKTMENYRAAKLKLFRMLKEKGAAVVNLDMEKPEEFLKVASNEKIGYLVDESSERERIVELAGETRLVVAKSAGVQNSSSSFEIENQKFELKLPGKFNIENALAAICVCLSQKVGIETCARALGKIKNVPGRMDYVENDRGIDIIIDYALTPDSMEKLGQLLSSQPSTVNDQKLIWVFGSCGERDRGKRPIMGEIVAKHADYAIVTNEDPYHEDPQRIIDEVCEGVFKGGKQENENVWKIFDRREAIKKALELAQKGDTVLITGKGAEETMAIGDKRIHWNDREVVEELLEEM